MATSARAVLDSGVYLSAIDKVWHAVASGPRVPERKGGREGIGVLGIDGKAEKVAVKSVLEAVMNRSSGLALRACLISQTHNREGPVHNEPALPRYQKLAVEVGTCSLAVP
jgi:hypothetical protein